LVMFQMGSHILPRLARTSVLLRRGDRHEPLHPAA
jgi:hypothetical protein